MVALAKPSLYSARPLCTGDAAFNAAVECHERGDQLGAALRLRVAIRRYLQAYNTWHAAGCTSDDIGELIDALRKVLPSYSGTFDWLAEVVESLENQVAFKKHDPPIEWCLFMVAKMFVESWLSRKGGAL